MIILPRTYATVPHYLYYFIPLPAESEILLTFKRRKHEELIDYGIFSQLDFAALC